MLRSPRGQVARCPLDGVLLVDRRVFQARIEAVLDDQLHGPGAWPRLVTVIWNVACLPTVAC